MPLRAARRRCVHNTCACTARALCTLASFFIRRPVGLAKAHPCTEFGVASSKFPFTGGPHVITSSPHRNGTPTDFKLVQYACDLCVWTQRLLPFDLQGREEIFRRPLRGGTCHVPRAAGRSATGTIVVPAFRRVHRCHPGPDRISRSGAIPGNARTHRQTHRLTNTIQSTFSATHRRKSLFIKRVMLKHWHLLFST